MATSSLPISSLPGWQATCLTLIPLGGTAALAIALAAHPSVAHAGISALTLAICAGMIACNTLPRQWLAPLAPGILFARQRMLRVGVALYGVRLTFESLAGLGVEGIAVPLTMLVATLVFGTWVGSTWLGLSRREALVISAGSAVCGAAAAIAVSSVVRAGDRQTAVAVATVVLFGTAGMFLYPYLFDLLNNVAHVSVSQRAFGIFTGATLHEVAQVIAAGKMIGEPAADAAVLAKMVRVLALGPLLLALAFTWREPADSGNQATGAGTDGSGTRTEANRWRAMMAAVPWFAVAFIGVMAVNSAGAIPVDWKPALVTLDNWLLACAMLAIGLHTRLRDLLEAGRAPMLLAGLLFVFLIGGGALLCAVAA